MFQTANAGGVFDAFEAKIAEAPRVPTSKVQGWWAFNDPSGSFGSPAFGTITSAGNPRDFEFALKAQV